MGPCIDVGSAVATRGANLLSGGVDFRGNTVSALLQALLHIPVNDVSCAWHWWRQAVVVWVLACVLVALLPASKGECDAAPGCPANWP